MVQANSVEIIGNRDTLNEPGTGVSVVIPALNEAESIPELLRRLDKVAYDSCYRMQVILVDDGSTDNTESIVQTFQPETIESISYLRFRVNMGKSTALSEGVDLAEKEIIVTMDADLQDQPEEIPKLVNGILGGCDVVSGWKKQRHDPFLGKKLPSMVFNWLVRKILNSPLKDINCGLKAYRKEVWDVIRVYGEFHRFIPALAANRGFVIGEAEVEHCPRTHGVSKYGASRFVKGVFDLLTVYFLNAYRHRPLHFFGVLGVTLGGLGFIGASYLTLVWFMGNAIGTRPLLQLSVLLLIIGVQVVLFGLMAQLQIELFYKANKDKPHAEMHHRSFKKETEVV